MLLSVPWICRLLQAIISSILEWEWEYTWNFLVESNFKWFTQQVPNKKVLMMQQNEVEYDCQAVYEGAWPTNPLNDGGIGHTINCTHSLFSTLCFNLGQNSVLGNWFEAPLLKTKQILLRCRLNPKFECPSASTLFHRITEKGLVPWGKQIQAFITKNKVYTKIEQYCIVLNNMLVYSAAT